MDRTPPAGRRSERARGRAGRPGVLAVATGYIWGDETDRPHWQRPVISSIRLLWAVSRDLSAGQLTLQAMSLVYTTLLSLVPLLAISFSILKGFGVHNQIEPFLLNALEPLGDRRAEVVSRIVGFVDNVQVGVLGSVGFVLLFYTVISLMQKIEHAFNGVWQVSAKRSLSERFKDYLSVIIVGPVLVFAALGISATVLSDPLMARIISIQPVGMLVELIGHLVPVAMVTLAFTFIYMFVPNTRVRLTAALTGALVAGLLWNAVGWLFAAFVAQANSYTAIYSGFATPIVFMIWLYVGWLILLVGTSIAFYRQHPEYLSGRQLTNDLSAADRDRLALHCLFVIGRRFYSGEPAPNAEVLGEDLRIPASAVEQVLEPLRQQRLLACTDAEPRGYLPGCPWEAASVDNVLEAVYRAGTGSPGRGVISGEQAVDAVLEQRRAALAAAFGGTALRSLVTEMPATPAGAIREMPARAPS